MCGGILQFWIDKLPARKTRKAWPAPRSAHTDVVYACFHLHVCVASLARLLNVCVHAVFLLCRTRARDAVLLCDMSVVSIYVLRASVALARAFAPFLLQFTYYTEG